MKFTAVYLACAEGGYTGMIEEIPGAISQGESLAETRANLEDALKMVLECNRDIARSSEPQGALREPLELLTV